VLEPLAKDMAINNTQVSVLFPVIAVQPILNSVISQKNKFAFLSVIKILSTEQDLSKKQDPFFSTLIFQ